MEQTDKFNTVGIASSVSDLKGVGLECLVCDGEIIAKFFDGQMIVMLIEVNQGKTLV